MKFSHLRLGTRATKEVDVLGAKVLLRPLSAGEDSDVVADATRHAKAKGITDPADGHPVFDAAVWAFTLERAALDPDSPASAREPFFDGGAAQILKELDTDALAQLYEAHKLWQEECSPTIRARSFGELVDLVKKVAGVDGDRFFLLLSPRTQLQLARTSAALALTSPDFSALTGSPSAPTTENSSPTSESAPVARAE